MGGAGLTILLVGDRVGLAMSLVWGGVGLTI